VPASKRVNRISRANKANKLSKANKLNRASNPVNKPVSSADNEAGDSSRLNSAARVRRANRVNPVSRGANKDKVSKDKVSKVNRAHNKGNKGNKGNKDKASKLGIVRRGIQQIAAPRLHRRWAEVRRDLARASLKASFVSGSPTLKNSNAHWVATAILGATSIKPSNSCVA
jgi:hypothetical protein